MIFQMQKNYLLKLRWNRSGDGSFLLNCDILLNIKRQIVEQGVGLKFSWLDVEMWALHSKYGCRRKWAWGWHSSQKLRITKPKSKKKKTFIWTNMLSWEARNFLIQASTCFNWEHSISALSIHIFKQSFLKTKGINYSLCAHSVLDTNISTIHKGLVAVWPSDISFYIYIFLGGLLCLFY